MSTSNLVRTLFCVFALLVAGIADWHPLQRAKHLFQAPGQPQAREQTRAQPLA